jgi:predicted RNA-binding Zn-ribbon protein involved in translation (DUF1610 family)
MTREDAKAFMRKAWRETTKGSYAEEAYEMAIKALEQPTVEPERKTGKWIQFPNHMAYKCSECGRVIQTTDGQRNVSKHYPFCHCGAKMEAET